MRVRTQERRAERRRVDTARTLIEALFIAFVVRGLLFQPFNIPSGSMEPTLLAGDHLFVSKFSYGYSRYSLPFSPPIFSDRILAVQPSCGDRIQLIGGAIVINGTPLARERIADFVGQDPCRPTPPDSPPVRVAQWRETLPNGVSYDTLECASYLGFPDTTGVYTVPSDHLFMMGDNREKSEDSRFPDVGYVPFEHLIGRAQVIFFSVARGEAAWEVWDWPWSVPWSRLFTLLR